MTRMSKQQERRSVSPRKHKKISSIKTGPLKDNLQEGYKVHVNAIEEESLKSKIFIPKVK